MGWSIGFDHHWNRDVGYGVPAYCDHPQCDAEIDRGLSYVCGGDPYGGDRGCGLFFCTKHGGGYRCPRCANYKQPYKYPKADHPRWVRHKLTDASWQQWRDENPDEVTSMKSRETLGEMPMSNRRNQLSSSPNEPRTDLEKSFDSVRDLAKAYADDEGASPELRLLGRNYGIMLAERRGLQARITFTADYESLRFLASSGSPLPSGKGQS